MNTSTPTSQPANNQPSSNQNPTLLVFRIVLASIFPLALLFLSFVFFRWSYERFPGVASSLLAQSLDSNTTREATIADVMAAMICFVMGIIVLLQGIVLARKQLRFLE
jgi:hypothetical protein